MSAPATRDGIQVLGLCRFSVLSEGAFQTEHETVEDRRAYLWNPERMAQRFAWFEAVTLPGLRGQTDPDFRLVILLSEDMPEPWRSRIAALIASDPRLVAHFAPYERHRTSCANAMSANIDPEAEAVIQFRLDDDDAVAVDFVERLRRDFTRARPLWEARGPMVLDYGRGINLFWAGREMTLVPRLEHFIGVGFAVVTRPGDRTHILDYMHHVIWHRLATLTFTDEIMWLRGAHGGNDSGAPGRQGQYPADPKDLRVALRKRFLIEPPTLKAALRALDDPRAQA